MGFTLPNELRAALTVHRLPRWACDICDVPYSTTVAELPTEIATGSTGDLKALEHYFITLLTRRLQEPDLKAKRCLPHADFVLDGQMIRQMDLSKRTGNCLGRFSKEKKDGISVSDLTFGDLASIPHMGAKSIIEFLGYMENFDNAANVEIELGQQTDFFDPQKLRKLDDLLLEVRRRPWMYEIVCGDRRFPEISRPIGDIQLKRGETLEVLFEKLAEHTLNYPSQLLQSALETVASVQRKVESLEKMPLDEVLKDFIKTHYKRAKPKNLEALYARFGLVRESCLTLEESGQIAGVTRERIRQIESKILNAVVIGEYATFMPGLEKAVSLLNNSIGISVLDFSEALKAQGITRSNISADSVVLFAEVCRLDTVSVSIERVKDGTRVIASDDLNLNRIDTICRRLCSRNGIADIKLAARHFDGDSESFIATARQFLSHAAGWVPLDPEQRWWTPNDEVVGTRNRLVNVARKILSVSNPVSVDDLREGYLRMATFRNSSNEAYSGDWAIFVPSRSAILAFFELLDGFRIVDGQIYTDERLEFREELGDVERAIVEVIQNSPTGILTRNHIIRECKKRGVNENSLMLYTTYSPVVHRMAQETFKLVGKEIAASALSAHQVALSQKIKTKRILIADWKDGRIRLCVRIPDQTASMVVGAPSTLRDFLKSRNFEAYDLDNNPIGTIGSNEDGSMWGMGKFCQMKGLERDDILAIEFDLAASKAFVYQSLLSEILDDID